MKVESIEIFRVDMPMRDFFKNANHNHNVQPAIVVRVTADDGFSGIGDVEPVAGYSGLGSDEIADAMEQKARARSHRREPQGVARTHAEDG